MFLPLAHDFLASRCQKPADFANFVWPKAAIERYGQVIHPHLALGTGFEHVHVDTFAEIITIKAHTIPILDKNRRHSPTIIVARSAASKESWRATFCPLMPPPTSPLSHHHRGRDLRPDRGRGRRADHRLRAGLRPGRLGPEGLAAVRRPRPAIDPREVDHRDVREVDDGE